MKSILRSLLPAFATLALLASPVVAKDFEGKVTFQRTTGTSVAPEVHYIKPGFLRLESAPPAAEAKSKRRSRSAEDSNEGMPGVMIMRLAEKKVLMLMPAQKQYMVHAIDIDKAAKNVGVEDTTFERTGKTEKIAGYDCAQYLTKSRFGTTELWAVEGLHGFVGTSGAGPRGGTRSPSGWEKMVREKGLFPLRTVVLDPKGKELTRSEATAVEPRKLGDDLFQPPADYTEFKIPGLPNLGDLLQGR